MTSEELTTLVNEFRKETEDLIMTAVVAMFNILFGSKTITAGDNGITLTTPYDSTDDYEITIHSAVDTDGTNIQDALVITKTSVSGFTIYSPRAGEVKWQSSRRTPRIILFTE